MAAVEKVRAGMAVAEICSFAQAAAMKEADTTLRPVEYHHAACGCRNFNVDGFSHTGSAFRASCTICRRKSLPSPQEHTGSEGYRRPQLNAYAQGQRIAFPKVSPRIAHVKSGRPIEAKCRPK